MKFLIALLMTTCLWANISKQAQEIQDQSSLEILTPSLSKRQVAKLRLENGLEAYLISDPGADQSAAALSMEVGSWGDDPNYPGIAHFLEHLLFMGSETYPEESEYEKQVRDNGGVLNAYTAPDRTVYIFSVNNDAFPATLDMFAHMFIDPLFNPSGIGRELHAVDQEHDKNIEHDGAREWMVMKETGNPHHPNASFSTGNSETLGGIPQKDVKRWHRENYSADRAHLTVYSTLPMEELKPLVANTFAAVPKRPVDTLPIKEKLFSEKQEGHVIAIQPVKEVRDLSLNWELPSSYVSNLENRSHTLLGYILGGRHPSSLYSELKKEELIEDVSSGFWRLGKECGLFSINFTLTPKGAAQFEAVIERTFQALNGVKAMGIPPYIFNEAKTMAKIDYEYQSRTAPYHFVSHHAAGMINEPLETYPLKTILPTTYNVEETEAFLSLLKPDTCACFLVASPELTGITPDHKEMWSGAEYAVQEFSEETLTAWANVSPHPEISIPEQNHFIPSDLKLVTQEGTGEMIVTPVPTKLFDEERGTLYFWEDTEYQVPEVSWTLSFATPSIDGSAHQSVLLDLYLYTLDEKLAPTLSFAEAASLNTSCRAGNMKLYLQINGFSEKAPLLLEKVLTTLKSCKMTKEEFELYTTSLKSSYANQGKAMPIAQANEILGNLLFNNAPLHTEKLAALESLTYEEYLTFADHLFKETYTEGMLIGNMTQTDAERVWQMVQEKLGSAPYPKKDHERRQILTLSSFQGPYKVSMQTESLGNAAILLIQEGVVTFPKKAAQLILSQGLQDDFFATLRTKQQTGYITYSGGYEEEDQLYKAFMVQSTTHQPDELIARFELFLETYVKDFEVSLPEGRFEVLRSNVITLLDTPPTNLSAMNANLTHIAFTHKGDFERRKKLIAHLKELTYEEFKTKAITAISRQNPRRIAIMLEGKQPKEKTFRYEGITADTLKAQGTYISLP
ncbi:insulinase family protein [Candidatus Neptunochlamydia vexilliferae]|uniref:Protease 3 n=1 Tax=Candidatus Neptunichlamydia vexilliferae TaxID=1651774 RepID=A0ABS0B0B1_9BACT|nr:insulinase family protein [Candidatus Neptunochlamydia vexilliferae]MBF5059831.1 hypothetical protein [Candidatus Neptunochlamydia vexilliferae]